MLSEADLRRAAQATFPLVLAVLVVVDYSLLVVTRFWEELARRPAS